MTAVRFAAHISHFTGAPLQCEANGTTVAEIIHDLDDRFEGLASYLIHENGTLRQHVNVFIDNRMIADREKLMDDVSNANEVVIMQALSGG